MVAASDLQQAMMLKDEAAALTRALEGLEHGDVIVAMTIGPPGGNPLRPIGVTIGTAGLNPPPAMIDTIRQELGRRRGEIEQQLKDMGVTGVGP